MRQKNVLLIHGGYEGHQPNECVQFFTPLLKDLGFSVRCCNDLSQLRERGFLSDLSLIVPIWTMGNLDEADSKALTKAVANGVGLAGWHGGMCDAFREDVQYQFMTGGQWVAHPGGCINSYRINITESGRKDSIFEGIDDFDMYGTEQYYMHVDPSNNVLATTTFQGNQDNIDWIAGTVMPCIWKKRHGSGRVFYSSLGHVVKDFEVPEVKKLTMRGLVWASEQEA